MTPEQKALIQTSYMRLLPKKAQAVSRFYTRLFDLAPELRPLFRDDLSVQCAKLMSALAALVQSLDDNSLLVERVRTLGERHARYGASAQTFEVMRTALVETMSECLGPAFDDATRAAWNAAFDRLALSMMLAARSGERTATS